LHLALTAGFLGGLTTYSSFNQDLIRLVRDGAYGAAALSFGVTAVGCIVAGLLGFGLAQKTVGH
jgi:CrcB protein